MRLLRCIAQAVVANGLKALVSGIPFVGGLVEIADDAWKRYREQPARNAPPPEAALSAEVEALAQAPAPQVRQQVAEAVKESAADQPAEVQVALTSYLTQVPAMIRRSLRRPSDPGGSTVPANRVPRKAADLLPFLPPKLPRFKPGDRPLPGVNWELVELLGVGGFGEVWKAHHPSLTGITAALKFCLDAEAGKLLRHEASALNRVMQAGRHAGIVPLRQAYLDADPVCLEYEYVEGGDLGGLIQELHQRGKVKPEEVARWMLHLAATVRFAHQMKPPLVHRDLKPANILVQRSPEGKFSLRVADFGISAVAASQALGEAARTPTSRNSLLATAVRGAYTPLYASPQQMKGEPADPRDDVHALGVIWYQMLTGDLSQGPLIDYRDELTERGIPDPMIDLLARCVAGRAERRLSDAGELVQQLEALVQVDGRPSQSAPATAGGAAGSGRKSGKTQRSNPQSAPATSNRAAGPGLDSGTVGEVSARVLPARPMSLWVVRVLLLIGGMMLGWLVYLYLASGDSGVGGPGGNKPGSSDKEHTQASKPPEKEPLKTKPDKKGTAGEPVRIEVLGSKALKILKLPTSGPYHGYRIEGDEEKRLYDLSGIETVLRERRQQNPKLRVVVVIYKDSPDRDFPLVADLRDWLIKEDITWELAEPPAYSPEVRNSQP